MERVAPSQVNYDNVLPLAIESRSNRREFLPVNGQTFSNTNGATICRIDVNADSMLDATHSYLECNLNNDIADVDTLLAPNPFCPAWIQRLRIESGGVVIEDINEYARLYAMLVLNQCPEDYIKNNLSNQGLYRHPQTGNLRPQDTASPPNDSTTVMSYSPFNSNNIQVVNSLATTDNGATPALLTGATLTSYASGGSGVSELVYSMSCQAILKGCVANMEDGEVANSAENQPNAGGLVAQSVMRIDSGKSRKMAFPLVSGFLNMDRYIPLIMMNAGFTIELTLCDAARIGISQQEKAGENQQSATDFVSSVWSITAVKYVAHLIDLDRSFYDTLRAVMESSGGVLQLAGQTYRHFVGDMPANAGPHTITLPARVKSVKSIFGTFLDSQQMGSPQNYDTSVFQNANLQSYRFEIGSVRYPQTDVDVTSVENEVELQKAWGKLGDYSHQQAYSHKHTLNVQTVRNGTRGIHSLLSAFFIGYDFEAFQRVALESGINTADRSLPINFICSRVGSVTRATRCDFYVLTDAIYYINLDGTVSVSV